MEIIIAASSSLLTRQKVMLLKQRVSCVNDYKTICQGLNRGIVCIVVL